MQYRILVIEDDTDINNVIADTLTKAGYICTQAFSGTEALLYLERENYALAVMDLMLPGLSGEDLLPKLKEKQSIPVIVVSAKDGLDSKNICLNEMIQKSFYSKIFCYNCSLGIISLSTFATELFCYV